jgi:hypothetical protein
LRGTNALEFLTDRRIHERGLTGTRIDVQIHLLTRSNQRIVTTTMQRMKQVNPLVIHAE